MPKTTGCDEVEVLRFFEDGPIEKVEVVYNIVCDKMRERLAGRPDRIDRSSRLSSGYRKRTAKQNSGADAADQHDNEKSTTGQPGLESGTASPLS